LINLLNLISQIFLYKHIINSALLEVPLKRFSLKLLALNLFKKYH